MRKISEANAQWQSNRPATSGKGSKHRRSRKPTEPAFIEPMQCKPVAVLPADDKWTFEIKFDGYRCIAVKRGSEVTLFSRNKKILNKRFPKISDALAVLKGDFVVDGELVAFDPQGRPSFQLLQNTQSRALSVYFFVFDLLNLDGEALLSLSLEHRRDLLATLFTSAEDPLRLSAQLQAPSGQIIEAVRQLGLEGVVGKQIDSVYEPGQRSGAWIKHRTNKEQEFVVGGYIPGSQGFYALLVGVYENKRLMFVAKVKNGFLPSIRSKTLRALETLKTRVSVRKSPRGKSLPLGRGINRGKDERVSLGHTEPGLPGGIC
jgi:DNA ligase D-like protein (predicted ligase)